jgi:hypothetical protein
MFALDRWPVHTQDVLVHNVSAALDDRQPFASFRPCAIFDMRPVASSPVPSHITLSGGQTFTPVWTRDDVTVYAPSPAQATSTSAAAASRTP